VRFSFLFRIASGELFVLRCCLINKAEENEAEEERAAHAAFDVEMECRREAAAAEDDSSDIPWSSDDPDTPTTEEKAAEQRALVDSFEMLKKVEDAAKETLQMHLLEEAAVHRALEAAWRAAEKQMREGATTGLGRRAASSLELVSTIVCSSLCFLNIYWKKKVAPIGSTPICNQTRGQNISMG
jgi:hypothetical protein